MYTYRRTILQLVTAQNWQEVGFVILIKYPFWCLTKAGACTFKILSKPIHSYLFTLNLRATKRST